MFKLQFQRPRFLTAQPLGAPRQPAFRGIVALTGAAALSLGVGLSAAATTVTLNAFETGSYSPGLLATPDYTTGITFAFGSETRGYLVFDLSSILSLGGTVSQATLLVQNRYSFNEVGPNDPLELRVFALPFTHAGNFGQHAGAGGGGNFAFIGSDLTPRVATRFVAASETGSVLEIALDPAGINDIQANRDDSFYAFGLRVKKADAQEPKPLQYVFAGSAAAGNQVQLVLEITGVVPEPDAGLLWLAGLPVVAAFSARRRRLAAG